MSLIPEDFRFAKTHEWLKLLPDGTALVGITDYAQSSLGDITFVQPPKVEAVLAAGEAFGVVESVKAASDIYSPVSGVVLAVNPALTATPELLNRTPYEDGWIMQLKPSDSGQLDALLTAADYARHIG